MLSESPAVSWRRGNWDGAQRTFSSQISEAKHLYLPSRRCCSCWPC